MATPRAPRPALHHRVTVSDHVLFQILGDDTVLLDLSSGTYFGLDPLGTRIWQLAQQRGRLAAVLERLVEEFDIDRGRAETDLLAFVDELARERLLTYA